MEVLFEFDNEYDEQGIFGLDETNDLEFFLEEIVKTNKEIDLEIIRKAFLFCLDYHRGVVRKSGYPYYTHPLNVALILLREFTIHDTTSIAACLLHDTIEDVKSVSKSLITHEFSEEIAEMVDAVTKIDETDEELKQLNLDTTEINTIKKAETYRKLFLALVKDVRVILIKLADRLHNLRTLHYLRYDKQVEISKETLNFYVPFAHRLGLNKIKMELENRSFYYTDRNTYEAIRLSLNNKRRDFIDYIKVFIDHIQSSLSAKNIESTISIIHKHEYEIYQMLKDGKNLSDIDNFYSLVIILQTDDVHECYKAHGVLANAFNTISFVDYVANPRIDWFRSLNTELFGPDGKRVEILIRTEEMERIAEEGIAANFSLRSGRMRALRFNDKDLENWGAWMRDIILYDSDNAPQMIWNSIKVNLFDSELSVFTKNGASVKLPQGASLIDFAFALSDYLGLHCISGKVDGIVSQLNYKLKKGDQIEIIASPNATPKLDWKNNVVSYKAVYHLHNYFKNNQLISHSDKGQKEPFEVKLHLKGDDREGMLFDITMAIGSNYIRRVNLDTSGNLFEGTITIFVVSDEQLNEIFAKLLLVRGIKALEKLDNSEL